MNSLDLPVGEAIDKLSIQVEVSDDEQLLISRFLREFYIEKLRGRLDIDRIERESNLNKPKKTFRKSNIPECLSFMQELKPYQLSFDFDSIELLPDYPAVYVIATHDIPFYCGSTAYFKSRFTKPPEILNEQLTFTQKSGLDEVDKLKEINRLKTELYHPTVNNYHNHVQFNPYFCYCRDFEDKHSLLDSPLIDEFETEPLQLLWVPTKDVGNGSKLERGLIRKLTPVLNYRHNPYSLVRFTNIINNIKPSIKSFLKTEDERKLQPYFELAGAKVDALYSSVKELFEVTPLSDFLEEDWQYPYQLWDDCLEDIFEF